MTRPKGSKNKSKIITNPELAGTITFTDKETINFDELKKKVAEEDKS